MNSVDSTQKVRYLRDVSGLSFRQIAYQTGYSRHKVLRLYQGHLIGKTQQGFLLDPYKELILSWLGVTPSLMAIQIWKRLKDRGVAVSYRSTAEYTHPFRKKKKDKVYWPLTFLPGEEGQVDWFFLTHPRLGKLAGFVIILSYSRYAFAHFFPRFSFEFFIEGHLLAFDDFGGCPHALRYDNLKSVVLKREPLTYNPSFLEFARHYGFGIELCNPAAGNEKGRVERLIRSIRDTFVNTANVHQSLTALNDALHAWIKDKNATTHRATKVVPIEAKKEEKLKTLPVNKWTNVLRYPPKLPTKTGFIIFDTNLYSVPEHAAHQSLALSVTVDRINIFDAKENRVASHPRLFEKRKTSLNPLHRSVTRLSNRAKRQRIHNVILNIDPMMDLFLEQNRSLGEDPYHTAYLLFKLLKSHSRGLLLSLIRQALEKKSCRLNFIVSHLNIGEAKNGTDPVSPQNTSLLALDYQARPLEEYDAKP